MSSKRALIALVAVAACHSGQSAPADISRVVCVSKQINEFVYAIGAQSHLVARDLTSIYPPEITKLPSVGYHRALSAEGITSMRPTLLLTDGNVGPDAVLDQVRKVGIPVVTLPPGNSPDSAEQLMTELGRRFGRTAAADSVVGRWKKSMDSIFADTSRWSGKPRPRVLVMHFGQLGNTYLGVTGKGPTTQIIQWAGGVNAIDTTTGMQRLTPEIIARAAPDIILATDVGFDRVGSVAAFQKLPGVDLTPAGRAGKIYRIDETEVMYFGPRTPASVRKIESILHS
jgi:iron complex transport system substrate-binding protein